MILNEGAKIVPINILQDMLDKVSDDRADTPDNYARVQLLTEEAIHFLVFRNHDSSYIVYGALSSDFPLCVDFADICAGDVKRASIKAGLAVRPAFGTLEYTKNSINEETKMSNRHEINFAALSDGRVVFFEPQTDTWLTEPEDCKSMDRFRL